MPRRRALLIVDVQPTFCEGGELPVAGGDAVAAAVARHVERRRADYTLTATSQDWHVDPAGHFSDRPDFVDTWPPHGLAGSANAELHPALAGALGAAGPDVSVRKGQHAAAYSAFEGVDENGLSLARRLAEAGIQAIDVCDIAESHCVRASALQALELGYEVALLAELTVPVTAEGGAAARHAIIAAGGTVVRLSA